MKRVFLLKIKTAFFVRIKASLLLFDGNFLYEMGIDIAKNPPRLGDYLNASISHKSEFYKLSKRFEDIYIYREVGTPLSEHLGVALKMFGNHVVFGKEILNKKRENYFK